MIEKNIKSRIVNKHDTEANWEKATSFIPKQGEIIIYDIDSTHSYPRVKVGDNVTVVSQLPFINELQNKITTITLSASEWIGTESPYSQIISISGVTENSKIDFQPTTIQLIEFQNSNIAFMAENDNGVVTVYAINNKPNKDYIIQASITETKEADG